LPGPHKERMHFHLRLDAGNILWILTFAAQLVLLVVLMGRNHMRRFPWFTASIAVMALQQMTERLLIGRLPQITLASIFIPMADISVVLAILVLIEMGQRSFAGASRRGWSLGVAAAALPAIVVVAQWGHWPAWSTLTAHSEIALLLFGQLVAQKLGLFSDVATLGLCVLAVLLGRRHGAGFRSHPQQLVIGLATASLSQIAVQRIWQTIARSAAPHTMAEYRHILALKDGLNHANAAVYIVVLLWWIACLWFEEPGKSPAAAESGGDDSGNHSSRAGQDAGAESGTPAE
jgi:hypothetical protein